ncbi:MAG: MBL fold metallo-hydrolase [Chloroflexi bacterium]|nr:MBL fold metallo-hydrolase [Chloroflexota bacterium]MCI0574704.1 MBL fold metallo-hydrolase [Chloroflexota bacterium]MCI0647403.1 MBL fold metallo-hydrolase [Chloroflexota bacterium]MCI0728882.1 MBL fold metallo-hydrolase [Chloroflexota bacterium]
MEPVQKFVTSAGRCIYTFPVLAFPSLVANIYVISDGGRVILVDCGSGMEQSNKDLLAGFTAIQETFGDPIGLADVDVIVITHGHMDHFGGLPFIRQHTGAPIGVHPLDRRVLSHYEERVVVAARQLETFLQRAGVSAESREAIMAMYLYAKGVYRSTPVQFSLEEEQAELVGVQPHHVPGHCPGQVCLQVDDILLTADHVLSRTTPHQAPESITNHMGLAHYLDSLARIERLEGVRLCLGGHEEPMADLPGRIQAIRQVHDSRLNRVLDICREPTSTADISRQLFGEVHSYHILLALEEAGAHVEYLYQRGELVAANLEEIEQEPNPVIRYQRV